MHNHMKRVTMTATDFCSDCIDQSQQISNIDPDHEPVSNMLGEC